MPTVLRTAPTEVVLTRQHPTTATLARSMGGQSAKFCRKPVPPSKELRLRFRDCAPDTLGRRSAWKSYLEANWYLARAADERVVQVLSLTMKSVRLMDGRTIANRWRGTHGC